MVALQKAPASCLTLHLLPSPAQRFSIRLSCFPWDYCSLNIGLELTLRLVAPSSATVSAHQSASMRCIPIAQCICYTMYASLPDRILSFRSESEPYKHLVGALYLDRRGMLVKTSGNRGVYDQSWYARSQTRKNTAPCQTKHTQKLYNDLIKNDPGM